MWSVDLRRGHLFQSVVSHPPTPRDADNLNLAISDVTSYWTFQFGGDVPTRSAFGSLKLSVALHRNFS